MLEDAIAAEPIDLLDNSRTPQLRSQLMENLSDRFMRQIAFSLFQRMRHSVSLLSCINGVMSHESAMSQLPEVMLAGVAELAPLRGRMLLAVDGDLIGAVVDGLCGAAAPHPFERYELSPMETRIGKQIVDLALREIQETLQPLTHMNLTPIAYENASGMLAIADGQDWMIAVTGILDTAFGTGTIKLITPYASFEPLEAKFSTSTGLIGGRGADAGWIAAIESMTDTTPVELRVMLARAEVPLLLAQTLGPGAILPFFLAEEALAVSGGVALFRAEYGQNDGFICCRVLAEGEAVMSEEKERAIDHERVELERLASQPRGAPAITSRNVLDRVQVTLTVELGRTQITVKDLRQLRHGQVVTLDQMVGDPLVIFANGQKLAFGEVVAVANDHYGVRVTGLAEDIEPSGEAK